MEECKVCGRKNPLEEANFCYYCGASFRGAEAKEQEVPKPFADALKEGEEETKAENDPTRVKRPFTMFQWLGMFLLLLIPLYGWIAFLVIASISAFGANATEERRAFAKAFLIFLVVAVVVLYLSYVYIQSNPELLEQYNKMLEQWSATGGQ